MPVGLYNSTIISCDFGDNVVVDNVNYMAHYIIGNDVMLVNINELATSNHAKFGNGTLKIGEEEKLRIWLEVCNENGGRNILPFDGMLPGDAYLWSRHRDDAVLQQKFIDFTSVTVDNQRGYYGMVGDRTVIKNTRILKDTLVGTDAYIKGANKIKNVTIHSSAEARTQIGEGCELVNGIIGVGCRVFYGVKAVRFVMASHSQLKYGARLINSYLGNNATISCCEVLNSLIFPAHEQHHNNSFLCAALVMGQSNMAAGATIGSNHNSRSADGELVAGRGFWPGLCVSLKHNSKFASFTILAKGDYPAELNIELPFSLVSNDVANDRLVILPGYWFQYNMYALARNSWKYVDRDQRIDKTQLIEFDYLAPDTANEMLRAIGILELATGMAFYKKEGKPVTENLCRKKGKFLLLAGDEAIAQLQIELPGAENSNRAVVVLKAAMAYRWYLQLLEFYAAKEILSFQQSNKLSSLLTLSRKLPAAGRPKEWENIGGQLIEKEAVKNFLSQIKKGSIGSWPAIHDFYKKQAIGYGGQKLLHALSIYNQVFGDNLSNNKNGISALLAKSIAFRQQLVSLIQSSREKDYQNPFRQMVYENDAEMDQVLGKISDNSFILAEKKAFRQYKKMVGTLLDQ
jgi:hypothetical protein